MSAAGFASVGGYTTVLLKSRRAPSHFLTQLKYLNSYLTCDSAAQRLSRLRVPVFPIRASPVSPSFIEEGGFNCNLLLYFLPFTLYNSTHITT